MQRIASLDTAGQTLRDETRRLTDALKRPGVRGRWGELQLKRVVELAGMVEHCDFTSSRRSPRDQASHPPRRHRPPARRQARRHRRQGAARRVPARRSKRRTRSARQELLADHARQVRAHLTQLAAKSYFDNVPPTPEFVVMFLPGEMFFSAALEQDPSLIEFGVEQARHPGEPDHA